MTQNGKIMKVINNSIFGMIHLSSGTGGSVKSRAIKEIEILAEEGFSGIIIENYHGTIADVIDVYNTAIEMNTELEIGINILPNDYSTAFDLNPDFVQLDYVSGKYEGRHEFIELDYVDYKNRKNTSVLGGVWPKYYRPVENSNLEYDLNLAMELCDAIVVTGEGTGKETPLDKIIKFKSYCKDFPLIIGAGVDVNNVKEQLKYANGIIIGSSIKQYKRTYSMIDRTLVQEFMSEVNKI
jgi:predicted TIM-barrel enzyme